MTALFNFVWSVYPWADPSAELLLDRLTEDLDWKHCPRKSLLVREGEVCRSLYFVETGLFRRYYTRGGKQITSALMRPGDICIVPDSLFTQTPSQENIEAIEAGTVSLIDYASLQGIYDDFPIAAHAARQCMQNCIISLHKRMRALWMQRAGDRYDWFVDEYPMVARDIPAKYLATYLGLTEVTFSVLKHGKEKWKGRMQGRMPRKR